MLPASCREHSRFIGIEIEWSSPLLFRLLREGFTNRPTMWTLSELRRSPPRFGHLDIAARIKSVVGMIPQPGGPSERLTGARGPGNTLSVSDGDPAGSSAGSNASIQRGVAVLQRVPYLALAYIDLDAGIRRFVAFLDRSGIGAGTPDAVVGKPAGMGAVFWGCLSRGVQVVPGP